MEYKVIGLMSGTSLDGVDLAFCTFKKEDDWSYEILATKTYPYSDHWLEILRNISFVNKEHLEVINKDLGSYYADLITDFCDTNHLIPDIVSSHGHTVHHQPEKGYTLQIGSGGVIASHIRTTTINDFRSKDLKLGGQGAPLVPLGDELLFSEYDQCLNLGGFANISFNNGKRVAYDICPCNMMLNELSLKIDLPYDKDGEIARYGDIDSSLLKELNALEYYSLPFPKSLGREWYLENILSLLEKSKASIPEKLATCTEHIAHQVSNSINRNGSGKILLTGGGSYNKFLIEKLDNKTTGTIVIPDPTIIDFKEAMIFAFLGVLRIRNEVNVLSSVTGANKDHCSGVIHNP
ncbi:MAG: anhydro-N-acetylmuramic acid kinase [Flavobacteriales bacterium]|nr:anhydro-N-acetylmuramic acid kinase [Flavobacteriales bacterium]